MEYECHFRLYSKPTRSPNRKLGLYILNYDLEMSGNSRLNNRVQKRTIFTVND